MLRVIAGKYRSRPLTQPPLDISRPTTDRVREAIFDALQFKIIGSIVLDLFSGSGAMAIEAVSRGAMKAIAVDYQQQAVATIRQNALTLNISNLDIVQMDAIAYLKRMHGTQFDIIFLDPPYVDYALRDEALTLIAVSRMLTPMGVVVLEQERGALVPIPNNLTVQRMREYGSTTIWTLANNI